MSYLSLSSEISIWQRLGYLEWKQEPATDRGRTKPDGMSCVLTTGEAWDGRKQIALGQPA